MFSHRSVLACDHALSLYLCNLLLGGGHDIFLLQITCKKAGIWTFFWLDRKQDGWFALFRLAKMLPAVSCCWFQSAFLLAYKWAVNTHASSLTNFCRLSFLEFEECLNRNFIHWNIFHLIIYLKVAVKNSPTIWMQFDTGYMLERLQTGSLFK